MAKLIAVMLLVLGTATVSMAALVGPTPGVPEIDPSSGISALALLAGAVVSIRGWRKNSPGALKSIQDMPVGACSFLAPH